MGTAADGSSRFEPEYDCSCDPAAGSFTQKRECCLRHQRCIPHMDDAIQVCRHYDETYLAESDDVTVSCSCDTSSGTADQQTQCAETRAACLRCALDSVATTRVSVVG